MFEALGLNPLTESVYLAMLQKPDASLGDLVGLLDVDETQIRHALDDLARMSLLHNNSDRQQGGAQTLRPVDPEVGLSVLLARQQAEVARRQQEIEESKAAVAVLLAKHANSRAKVAEPGVEYVEGIDAIRGKLKQLAGQCKWEACSFMPGGAQSAASLEASRALDAETIDRGVRLRTVYLDSVRNDQATLDYANWLSELGSEVRTTPALPLRMLLVDRSLALVPVQNENTAAMAMVITGDSIVAGLMALFNSTWKAATPLGTARRRDDEGLSAQERQVLLLLSEGFTDEVIARRLGVSVRTARRVASELLARLDARSRFQAGAKAVARGWIQLDDLL